MITQNAEGIPTQSTRTGPTAKG